MTTIQNLSRRGFLQGVVSENGKNRTLRERSAFREGATR